MNILSFKRIVAIGLVFLAACAGWVALGTTTVQRSVASSGQLNSKVEALWGEAIVQTSPAFSVEIPGNKQNRWIMPVKNDIKVRLDADYRKKGLLWYSTYVADFKAAYAIYNAEQAAQKVRIHFAFPMPDATYDNFSVALDGKSFDSPVNTAEGVNELIELGPGKKAEFTVSYRTRGLDTWQYQTDRNAGRVRGLDLEVKTNFAEVDYPEGSLSPMEATLGDGGMTLHWRADDLITHEGIGVIVPGKINPGPLTSRITFFAPVCLAFFFLLVTTIAILYKIRIHPMHYLFVAAGFFAFHLLLAYMAGIVTIHVAFVISATVSVLLVTGYLKLALREEFPWKLAVAGQLFYLVLFSYSFFLDGITGLTVAIGAVITLAVLMKATAHVDWEAMFSAPERKTDAAKPRPPLQRPPLKRDEPPQENSASENGAATD